MFRGVDLLDLWRGRLSPRRVSVLVRALPDDSATKRAMRADVDDGPLWGPTEYLLADVFDAVRQHSHLVHTINAKRPPSPPAPYPRPGDPKPFRVTSADLIAFRERTTRS